jgi:hypothetical protein
LGKGKQGALPSAIPVEPAIQVDKFVVGKVKSDYPKCSGLTVKVGNAG